ncbi:hypothetical protein PIB30_050041 [Stylosanthes scabra]|uniref:Uncharacterized protein n=1 Tax=Stylosanthes scabra TaxID=79078 RepID=A0ABU6ZGA6_9FABA|nr:hypothetical protein [Stylosanthes scabra]
MGGSRLNWLNCPIRTDFKNYALDQLSIQTPKPGLIDWSWSCTPLPVSYVRLGDRSSSSNLGIGRKDTWAFRNWCMSDDYFGASRHDSGGGRSPATRGATSLFSNRERGDLLGLGGKE